MYGVVKPFHSGRVGGGVFGGFLFGGGGGWPCTPYPPQPLARYEALKARGRRGGAMTALAGEPPHEHIPPPTTRITLQLDTASSV